MNKIAITTGDPNGIGAEITIKALNRLNIPKDEIILISNRKILDFYGKLDNNYKILEIPFDGEIEPGKISAECGEFSYKSVKKACEINPKAIVTAPVAKNALYLAGHKFNGQTEILQKHLSHDGQLAEMLLLFFFPIRLLYLFFRWLKIVFLRPGILFLISQIRSIANTMTNIIRTKTMAAAITSLICMIPSLAICSFTAKNSFIPVSFLLN